MLCLSVYHIVFLISEVNHPVHVINEDGEKSPSSFIPFCDFGGNMSAMGRMVEEFNVPVCNSFQAKILNDQLCYEVDLNNFSNKDNIERQLESGFLFIMDYNEDRQFTKFDFIMNEWDNNFISRIVESDVQSQAVIYFNTIGNFSYAAINCFFNNLYFH